LAHIIHKLYNTTQGESFGAAFFVDIQIHSLIINEAKSSDPVDLVFKTPQGRMSDNTLLLGNSLKIYG